jgi:hypothetical protein
MFDSSINHTVLGCLWNLCNCFDLIHGFYFAQMSPYIFVMKYVQTRMLPLPNFEENLHFEFQLGNEIRYDHKPGDFKVHVPKFRISVPVQVFQELASLKSKPVFYWRKMATVS